MKHFVEKIMDKEVFTEQDAAAFIHAIGEEAIGAAEIASVLTGIQLRGASLNELQGFRSALLERALKPEIDIENTIDVCGTGGDGKDTFNISTTSALVLAAMGHRVIKHGNYGVSSSCGSSNVLEALGFVFSSDSAILQKQLEEQNICFLHAPLFHPTMKTVAPVRRQLGVRTLFNSLGPLVNPIQPPFQITGTYSLELSRLYQHLLRPNRKAFSVVYGMDCFDEISLTDSTRVLTDTDDRILRPEDLGVERVQLSTIQSGGSIDQSVQILKSILKGTGNESQTNVVAANSALAIHTKDSNISLQQAFTETRAFIRSGQPAKHYNF